MKKYDVYVSELCDGNLGEDYINLTLKQCKAVCEQLFEGLNQLKNSNICHNDLKPQNILYQIGGENYEDGSSKVSIKIGDFGTAGRSGGTPGWTWPRFWSKREPGQSDMYSIALLILYIICDTKELFYRIRDNYATSRQHCDKDNCVKPEESWLAKLRSGDQIVSLVIKMMKLELTVKQAEIKWRNVSNGLKEKLTKNYLQKKYKIPNSSSCLDVQDDMDQLTINLVTAPILDKYIHILFSRENLLFLVLKEKSRCQGLRRTLFKHRETPFSAGFLL